MNYKRILASALALCLAMPITTVIPAENISALSLVDSEVQHFTDNFVYKIRGDYIEITAGMTNIEGDIEIPAEIDGVPVKVIGEHGLAGLQKVTSIILPDTITTIGKQAFAYNTALEKINIPENVRIIPDEAFMNCMSLSNIIMPYDLNSIGVRAFYGCRKITEIKLPASVQSLGEMAFADCQGLAKINIPSRINKLEKAVFGNCFALESLELPENVTFISKDALPLKIKNLIIKSPECELEDGLYMNITKDCVITAPPESTAQKFAETYGLGYEIYDEHCVVVPGDVNYDWEFNVADVVMMQNYLLGNGSLNEWQLGDMNNDGTLDVFDYILMLEELRRSPEYNPPYMPENPDPFLDYTAKNLTADMKSAEVEGAEADEEFIIGQTDFALNIFKREVQDDTNTLVSPYSIMQALAMTANGANGTTKEEMENVLEMPMDRLNKYLYTQRISQHSDENSKLNTANSIWAKEGVNVNKDFLQTNVDYYNADFYVAPFDDTTVTDINNWVNEKTDKMIPEILDAIPDAARMYLINAVAFDAKWEVEFDKYATREATFTTYDNQQQKAQFMSTSNGGEFISDDHAVGFYKYYADRKYAFAALMPEDMSLSEYISGLTAEGLNETLTNHQFKSFDLSMPKFSYDFDTLLNGTLIDMGMPTAFSEYADFHSMIEDIDTCISRIIHKTHIDVDEGGTKAAAVTVVEATECCIRERLLMDKPFVYFIIDTETNIPVFMGTLSSIPE
ncbi:MAG: leucine-rich repeat protein [Ruminococcus sp.]|nr:leucine-rich repeat protein [Ruminococcus sp.]